MRLAVLAFLAAALFVADFAEARWKPLQRVRRSRSNYTTYTNNTSVGFGDPQQIAERKAQIQANAGRCFHPGGGFGSATAEGVGFSTYSAQAALNNCCFTGTRAVAGQAVVRGANGFYACKLYW